MELGRKINKQKKFTYFVGIDISKNKLDFAVMEGHRLLFHREIPNDLSEIGLFLFELRSVHRVTMAKTLFCMENTGIYGNQLTRLLAHQKGYIVVDRPLQIKNSLGLNRDKSDKIDAIRIGKYAERYVRELRLWHPRRLVIQKLTSLITLRARLVKLRSAAEKPLREQRPFVGWDIADLSEALCSRTLTALTADCQEIDRTLDLLIQKDERLQHLFGIINSVPCVGRITTIAIIVATNEYLDITEAKKFACYAGVAPFIHESGQFKGKAKVSHIANKRIKTLLNTCAVHAIRNDPEIKAYYLRKINAGKHKMSVLNAVRNKLILRVFACLRQDRTFDPNKHRGELVVLSG